jgi:hypothetical protein
MLFTQVRDFRKYFQTYSPIYSTPIDRIDRSGDKVWAAILLTTDTFGRVFTIRVIAPGTPAELLAFIEAPAKSLGT